MYKKKDLLILASLRNDARVSLTDISKQTKIPVATIYERIKMFKSRIIKSYTTLIDFSVFGFNARANIAIKALPQKREELREFLFLHQNVNTLYKINNGYDYLIDCIFRNVKDLEEFLEVLDNKYKVKTRNVFYLIDDIKRETFMSDSQLLETVMPLDHFY